MSAKRRIQIRKSFPPSSLAWFPVVNPNSSTARARVLGGVGFGTRDEGSCGRVTGEADDSHRNNTASMKKARLLERFSFFYKVAEVHVGAGRFAFTQPNSDWKWGHVPPE